MVNKERNASFSLSVDNWGCTIKSVMALSFQHDVKKKIHCEQEGLPVEIKQPENINASRSSGFTVTDINVHVYTTKASTKSSNS